MGKKMDKFRLGSKIALGKTVVGVGRAVVKTRRAVRELGEDITAVPREFEIAKNEQYLKKARKEGWIGKDETNNLGRYLSEKEKRTTAKAERAADKDDNTLEYFDKIEGKVEILKEKLNRRKTNKIKLVGPGIIKVGKSK